MWEFEENLKWDSQAILLLKIVFHLDRVIKYMSEVLQIVYCDCKSTGSRLSLALKLEGFQMSLLVSKKKDRSEKIGCT